MHPSEAESNGLSQTKESDILINMEVDGIGPAKTMKSSLNSGVPRPCDVRKTVLEVFDVSFFWRRLHSLGRPFSSTNRVFSTSMSQLVPVSPFCLPKIFSSVFDTFRPGDLAEVLT